MRDNLFVNLALVFIPFSLTSIGGGIAIISGLQNEVVNVHGWITETEFVHLFAVSRTSPGPGTMLATALGWKIAGWSGAAVASLAFFLPSSLLCYAVFRFTNTHREKQWHRVMREGLAPVGTGLIIAGIISLFRLADGGLLALVIAGLSCALFFWKPKFPVLIVLALGGALAVLAWAWF
ncbi:chromate transporter [Rhizobium sp. XQZ8]|uniref:chromate transporter n=1 Tax=Rhizobium populisoli TaxID=2859785 RepID=UPI001C66BA1D|nr:chromate transporter [Rhizobium populisoli]MBW6424973.1 chromate transporter [Rhizobium populisoli]